MIPKPPCRRSNCRAGQGFTISNKRNNVKPSRTWRISTGDTASAIHCPATSSITTCPGSSFPVSRSTIELAEMPIKVTATAAPRVVSANPKMLRWVARAAKNHSAVAAREAHVPGPGWMRPMPKKVAVVQAHVVLPPPLLIGVVLIILVGAALCIFDPFKHFGIEHWRGNFVCSARPFAQIDLLAAVAAEGKVLVVYRYQSPAGRTAKHSICRTHSLFLALRDNPGDNIVVMRFRDLTAIKSSGLQLFTSAEIVDVNRSVDLRRMKLRASFPQ